jgi:hypothetical protein
MVDKGGAKKAALKKNGRAVLPFRRAVFLKKVLVVLPLEELLDDGLFFL